MKRYIIGERPSRLHLLITQDIHPALWLAYVIVAAGMAAYVVSSTYAGLYVVSAEEEQPYAAAQISSAQQPGIY